MVKVANPTHQIGLNREVVNGLRKSKTLVGPLHKIILDADGNVVAGEHRRAADPDWPVEVRPEIKTEKDRVLVKIHENYRKKMPNKKVKGELLKLAQVLVEEEDLKLEEICDRVCGLVPYSPRYVQKMLPSKYKRSGGYGMNRTSSVQPAKFDLMCGDFREKSNEIENGSVDIIITDPPYGKAYIPLYEDLGKMASRVLKDGGSLAAMAGQSYLSEILQKLCKHLTYNWIVAYLTPGGRSPQLWERKVNTFWKPVLWFIKGKYEGNWIGDVAKSNPNDQDKQYSEHGQSESGMLDIVKRFVKINQVILDPFMGAGTTGVVALKLGCSFIGIDINAEMVEIARRRLQEIVVKE